MSEQENMEPEKKGSFALGFWGTIVLYALLALAYYYHFIYATSRNRFGEFEVFIILSIYGISFFIASVFIGLATQEKEYVKAIFILLFAFAIPLILTGGCGLKIQ